VDRAKRCLSERPAPWGLFSRAEDQAKLSDNVIEDQSTSAPESRILDLSLLGLVLHACGHGSTISLLKFPRKRESLLQVR
jgi:hypothetical protein